MLRPKKISPKNPNLCHLVGQLIFCPQYKCFLYGPDQNILIPPVLGFSLWNADFLFFHCRWVVGDEWLSCDMPHARLDHVDGQQRLHECLDVATAREAADREAARGQLHSAPVVATGASQPWKGARRAAVRHCQGPVGRQQRGTYQIHARWRWGRRPRRGKIKITSQNFNLWKWPIF